MSEDYKVTGVEDLARVSAKFKAAGQRELRLELGRGLRRAGIPLKAEAKKAALENLPQTGGLNEFVAASSFGIRVRASGRDPAILLVGAKKGHDLNAMDRGRLRHPTYGRGGWVTQDITPGWWSDHMDSAAVAPVRREVLKAMDDVVRKVASGG